MQFSSPRKLMLPNVAVELWLGEMALPISWIGLMLARDGAAAPGLGI
jgi:hypothetical protein